MSGRNWLEREPQDSPGLQRIQEARRAAAVAKAQAEQQAREAAIAARETERKRLEMIARIEQKTAQVLPLLEEIRNFSNQTETYPIGPDPTSELKVLKDPRPQLLTPALVNVSEITDSRVVEVKYGLKGKERRPIEVDEGEDAWGDAISRYRNFTSDVEMRYGIRLKIVETGEIQLLRQAVVTIPGSRFSGVGPHTELGERWITIPENDQVLKRALGDAFHDPTFLGEGPLPKIEESNTQKLLVNTKQTETEPTGIIDKLFDLLK